VNPVTLRGKHVLLEPLGKQHVEPMRRIMAGDRSTFGWQWLPPPEGVEGYIEKAMQMRALAFATCRPDGTMVGSTRLFDLQEWDWPPGLDPRPGDPAIDACEIGHTWLAPEAQRTAINTEAKLLMLQLAFEVWRCYRVTLKTDARNEKSRTAIARLGAHFDGVLRGFQPGADGTVRNTAYFTIVDSEWPAVKARLTGFLEGR
jgi:RimJ/RimL family protein N-acetyltransferase